MIKEIIPILHFLKLFLLKHEKLGKYYWMYSLCLFICSNYLLVKDIFRLYYTMTIRDARKHLLVEKKTTHPIYDFRNIHIFINLVLICAYIYIAPQELKLLFFTFLLIFLHRCFYKASSFESEDLNFSNDLSLGYGGALCYYENYLKYILQESKKDLLCRIRVFKTREGIENMSHKHFILIPTSCKVQTYPDDCRPISRCKELMPLEIDIAGIPKRKYQITVYHVRFDDSNKSVRLAMEYAQPLKGLFDLKEKGLLSIEEMHKQREIFTNILKEMLSRSKNSEQIHIIEYDDELPSHNLPQVIMNEKAVFEYEEYKI